jgi:hypothetical protein
MPLIGGTVTGPVTCMTLLAFAALVTVTTLALSLMSAECYCYVCVHAYCAAQKPPYTELFAPPHLPVLLPLLSSHGQRRTTHGAQHVCVCLCVLVCVIIVMWIAVTFGAGDNELGTEGGAGAKALAEALRHLPNLTSIDLSKCVWAMFGCSMCWA